MEASYPYSYTQARKRSSFYGSRHLIYDMPIPIDECQNDDVVIRRRLRRNSMQHSSSNTTSLRIGIGSSVKSNQIFRVHSLQLSRKSRMSLKKTPVCRNVSSAGHFSTTISPAMATMQIRTSAYIDDDNDENSLKSRNGFQQFLHRMSSRKSNKAKASTRTHHPVSETTNSIRWVWMITK